MSEPSNSPATEARAHAGAVLDGWLAENHIDSHSGPWYQQSLERMERALERAGLPPREKALIDAAEEVVTHLAVVRAGRGAIGGVGMLAALDQLAVACDAYEPEEIG